MSHVGLKKKEGVSFLFGIYSSMWGKLLALAWLDFCNSFFVVAFVLNTHETDYNSYLV